MASPRPPHSGWFCCQRQPSRVMKQLAPFINLPSTINVRGGVKVGQGRPFGQMWATVGNVCESLKRLLSLNYFLTFFFFFFLFSTNSNEDYWFWDGSRLRTIQWAMLFVKKKKLNFENKWFSTQNQLQSVRPDMQGSQEHSTMVNRWKINPIFLNALLCCIILPADQLDPFHLR